MNKTEFMTELSQRLSGLNNEDIKKSLAYYNEIIEDCKEDGMSEEEAVASLGNIDEIATQIVMDTPITKLVKEKVKGTRTLRTWEIILIVLGSPIWLSLGIAFFAVVFSLYISVWSIVFSLFVTVFALFVSAFAFLIAAVWLLFKAAFVQSAIFFGAALVIAGVTILMYLGTYYTAKGIVILTKIIFKAIKKSFVKKEEV